MNHNRFILSLLITALMINALPGGRVRASQSFQQDTAFIQATQLISELSIEEKVGQLFLVSFKGSTAAPDSQIIDLIRNYHVGGIMLSAADDNFVAAPDTITSLYELIAQLQNAGSPTFGMSGENQSTSTPTINSSNTPSATTQNSTYIPLFIGVTQAGDGYPSDQILSGLTPLPNLMAIGATWNPDFSQQVGAVAGKELSALGINFFIGPSLDVLEAPETNLGNGLDAGVFGGDPYWVGALGSAYISGLHEGSGGRIVVVANHFPGRGSSDRPVEDEPSTVRKSLEQLKQIELAPFFAVTGNASSDLGKTDGLLVSHIRYQGFQGNIRSTTRPVSFDPQALAQILSLPTFASWREDGGLMVSDDLGRRTVESFYTSAGQAYQARLVARDAFLAGNDLLLMGNIVAGDAADNYSAVVKSIEFFIQKYEADPAFATKVDDAVLRLLTEKFRLYPTFDSNLVTPVRELLSTLGQSLNVTFEIARQSATLVSPDILDLESVLPSSPAVTDRIVFLTDTRAGKQCSTCPDEYVLAVDSLQNAILRLFGPQVGGQVVSSRLSSFTFDSLSNVLSGGMGNSELEYYLHQANWVIINMLDAEPGQIQTTVLRRFLSERQDLLRNKHIVVFAFNAPYFLDATDISKLTAYYCLYSKSAPFIDAAALLLFRELTPAGVLPVSVSGIGYDLLSATSPDPLQVIDLSLDLPSLPESTGTTTPEPTNTPSFVVGDVISIKTGTILDHNGHFVPDGTGVRFKIVTSVDGSVIQQIDATTTHGIARASFNLAKSGLFEISASSDPAITSVILQLNISNEGYSLTVIAPTEVNQPTVTPQEPLTNASGNISALDKGHPGFGGWFFMVFIISIIGLFTYWIGNRFIHTPWPLRFTLCSSLGGLAGCSYLVFRLPGTVDFLKSNGWYGLFITVFLSAMAGLLAGGIWYYLITVQKKQSK